MLTAIFTSAAVFLLFEAALTFVRAITAQKKDATVGCLGVLYAVGEFATAVGMVVLAVLVNLLPWHL